MMSLCSPENAPESADKVADLPILYSFRRCPYAMRARLALEVAGIKCRLREVVLRDKPDEMIEISPKATVPVLQLADGTVIEESREIMIWALEQNDPEGWLDIDRAEAEALIDNCDGPFKHALDRYKYPNRYDLADGLAHRERGMAFIGTLEGRLRDSVFLSKGMFCLPDAAIFPFVRQFANTDRTWFDSQPIPQVQRWLSAQLDSPRFVKIMKKYAQWKTGDDEPIFL